MNIILGNYGYHSKLNTLAPLYFLLSTLGSPLLLLHPSSSRAMSFFLLDSRVPQAKFRTADRQTGGRRPREADIDDKMFVLNAGRNNSAKNPAARLLVRHCTFHYTPS